MAVKTITVTEQAYRALKSKKEPHESFSDVILRITKRPELLEFFGILTEKEGERLEKTIRENKRDQMRLDEAGTTHSSPYEVDHDLH